MPASADLAVHPDRLRAALDPRLSEATLARLTACERTRTRIATRLGIEDGEEGAGVPDWLLAHPEEAVLRAGAVLHGSALRGVVAGPEVAALVHAIGRGALALGLRHATLAPPLPSEADLPEAIRRDGHACLGAWLATRPGAIRHRTWLVLPPGTTAEAAPVDPAIAAHADTIMALVAADLAAEADTHETGGEAEYDA